MTAGAATAAGEDASRPPVLRVCLDVNIFVTHLMTLETKRRPSAASRVIEAVTRKTDATGRPIQLSISLEMLDTLDRVLRRLGIPRGIAHGVPEAVAELARSAFSRGCP